jgi:outer membrane murein-binding lipoprotein Lpp
MKRLIAAGAVALTAAAIAAGGAAAANTPSPAAQLKTLNAQVKALNAQVKALKAQVKALDARERFDRGEIQANYAGDTCLAAGVADLFQSTWAAIDNGSPSPKFVGAGPIDDKQACTSIAVKRPGVTTSPTTTFLAAIVSWLFG